MITNIGVSPAFNQFTSIFFFNNIVPIVILTTTGFSYEKQNDPPFWAKGPKDIYIKPLTGKLELALHGILGQRTKTELTN